MTTERFEVQRTIQADPAAIFAIVSDPQGHVDIDSSGMLLDAEGDPVTAVGDSFVAGVGDPEHLVGWLAMLSVRYVAADEMVDQLGRRGWAVASGASFTAVRLICVPPDALALPLDTVKVNPPTGAVPS